MREDGQCWKRGRSDEKKMKRKGQRTGHRRVNSAAGHEPTPLARSFPSHPTPNSSLSPSTLCFCSAHPILTCSSVMDMISCQVNSISPSSPTGSCDNLFLFCWGGHGGILLCQLLALVSPKLKELQQPVWKEEGVRAASARLKVCSVAVQNSRRKSNVR